MNECQVNSEKGQSAWLKKRSMTKMIFWAGSEVFSRGGDQLYPKPGCQFLLNRNQFQTSCASELWPIGAPVSMAHRFAPRAWMPIQLDMTSIYISAMFTI